MPLGDWDVAKVTNMYGTRPAAHAALLTAGGCGGGRRGGGGGGEGAGAEARADGRGVGL
jgi:hypothetical protein